MVIKTIVPLFNSKKQQVRNILKDTVVKAYPSSKYNGWLRVRIGDKTYSAEASQFIKTEDLVFSYLKKKNELETKIKFDEIKQKELNHQSVLLKSITRQMEYDRYLNADYAVIKNQQVTIANNLKFTIDTNQNGIAAFHRVKARKVLKDWSTDYKKVSKQVLTFDDTIKDAKKDLLNLDEAEKEINKKIQKAIQKIIRDEERARQRDQE